MSTIRWFGGQRSAGEADMSAIDGPLSSTTVTLPAAWLKAPFGSCAASSTGVVPSTYGAAGDCVSTSGSRSASVDPSSTDASATHWSLAEAVTFLALATGT